MKEREVCEGEKKSWRRGKYLKERRRVEGEGSV